MRRIVEPLEDRTLLTVASSFDALFGELTITADAADNIAITASGGNVKVNGADPGTGTLSASAVTQINVTASGLFNNTIDATGVTAAAGFNNVTTRLEAGEGNDTITGSEFRDTINGGDGNDQLTGGAGDDQYEFFIFGSGSQSDVIDESGGGNDFVCIFTEAGGATLDLSVATAQTVVSGTPSLILTLGSGSTIENGCANFGGNLLTGNTLNNMLNAGGTVLGGDGDDTLNGGPESDDSLVGGAGNDVYEIFDFGVMLGTDIINETGGGTDELRLLQFASGVTFNAGTTGSNQSVHTNLLLNLVAGSTLEILSGGDGNDTLTAAPGVNTRLRGDFFGGVTDDDLLTGSTGNDTLEIGGGNDTLRGGAGNDTYLVVFGNMFGTDLIDESTGSGSDTFDLSGYDNFDNTGATLDLDSTSAQSYGNSSQFTFSGVIENLTGSPFNDTLSVDPLANVTRIIGGADPTSGSPGDTLNVDLMNNSFTHTPGATGSGTIDVTLVGGTGTIGYSSIETLNLLNPPAGAPSTVFVNDDFAGFSNGTPIADADPNTAGNQAATFGTNAFATIQEGVNAVDAGGTVHIIDGTYAESVSIAKPLTLNGTGSRGNIIIDPDNSGLANGITLTAGADNVTIQHLSVIDATGHGISATGVLNLALNDVEVSNSGTDGFRGESLSSTFSVTNSVFSQSGGDGIDVSNSASADVIFVDVTANQNDPGVRLSNVSAFSDSDGVYSGNDDGGIVLEDVAGSVTLIRTTLEDNDADNDGSGDGLTAIDGADVDSLAIGGNLTVLGATIRDSDGATTTQNQRHGVFVATVGGAVLFEDSPGIVRPNEITGNVVDGVVIFGAASATFTGGSFSGNRGGGVSGQGAGIRLGSVTGAVSLDHTNFTGNAARGFAIVSAASATLSDLILLNNPSQGGALVGVPTLTFTATTGNVADVVTVTDSLLTHARGGLGQNNIEYTGVTTLTVNTDVGDDHVTVTTSPNTTFNLNGGDPAPPAAPGDTLIVNVSGITNDNGSTVTDSPNLAINYQNFETRQTRNPATDIVLAGTGGNDLLIINATNANSGTYQFGASGTPVSFSGINSFSWNAGDGSDTLRVNNPAGSVFAPAGTVIYDGGTGFADRLELLSGSVGTVTHSLRKTGLHNYEAGSVIYDGQIAYTLSGLAADQDGTAVIDDRVSAGIRNLSIATRGFGGARSTVLLQPETLFVQSNFPAVAFDAPSTRLELGLDGDAASQGSEFIIVRDSTSGFTSDVTVNAALNYVVLTLEDITLANRKLTASADFITVNGTINSIDNSVVPLIGGDVRLTAPDILPNSAVISERIHFTDTGSISTAGGSVTIDANNAVTMADGATIDAGSGRVNLLSRLDSVTLGGVSTTGTVTISAGGSILDGGDTHTDITAAAGVLTAGGFNPFAGTGGHISALETAIQTLEASAGLNILLTNMGDLVLGGLTSASGAVQTTGIGGNIDIETAGRLTVSGGGVRSGGISLATIDAGTSGQDIVVQSGVAVVNSGLATGIILRAGDNVILEPGSTVDGFAVTLNADAMTGDAGTGATVDLGGRIAGEQIVVSGGSDDDLLIVRGSSDIEVRSGDSVALDGKDGNDVYEFHLPGRSEGYEISDSGGGTDTLRLIGTAQGDGFYLSNTAATGFAGSASGVTAVIGTISGFGPVQIPVSPNVEYTNTLEIVEVRGGDGNDVVEVEPSSVVSYRLFGGDPMSGDVGVPPGDTLIVDAGSQSVTVSPTTITVAGGGNPIQWSEFETNRYDDATSVNIVGLGGSDRYRIAAQGNGTTSINARVQQPDGSGGFLVDSFFDVTYQVGAGQNASIDGGGGTDSIEFLGGDGNDSFSIGPNGVMIGEQSIDFGGFASLSLNPGGGSNVITIDGGISIPNFINLVGDGSASSELRLNLAGTTGNLRINSNVASQVNEGSGVGVHIIEGFAGGGFVEVSGFGRINVLGDGNDNLTVSAPRIPDPTSEAGVLIGLLRVAGSGLGDGTDSILIGLLRTDGGSEGDAAARIGFSGLNDVNVESSGNSQVEFHTATLAGAAAYHAMLTSTDAAVIAGGSTISNPITGQRVGNAWQVTNNGATNPKPINLTGGNRYEVRGGSLDDTLTFNETGGLITQPGGVHFDGGAGFDTLRFSGATAVASSYQVGPGITDGVVTHANASGTQRVGFTGLEPVLDLVPGTLTLNATNADNAINVAVGPSSTTNAPTGVVTIDGFESYEFGLKTTVTINGLAGQDVFGVSNLSSGFSGLLVLQGDDPADGDELILNGSASDDVFGYLPDPELPDAGTITGLGGGLLFFGIEDVTVAGGLGNDSLTALGGVGTATRSFTTPATGGTDSKIFAAAFATNSTSGTDTSLRAFGGDGLTPIGGAVNDNSGPLNAALIAGAAVPADELSVTFVVGSGDGQNISEFDFVGGLIAPSEFTTEDEPNNNSTGTVNPIAVTIDQSGRVAQLGQIAPLSGDVDLIAVTIDQSGRSASQIVGGDISVTIDQSGLIVGGGQIALTLENGGFLSLNVDDTGLILGGTIAVNVDQSDRVIGRVVGGQISVNVDQSDRVLGGQISVNVDNSDRVLNGEIAVNIDQSDRVIGGEVSVTIDQSGRIAAIINNDPNRNSEFTQTSLRILGSDGETVIATGSNLASAASNAIITGPLETGTYYIEITNGATSGESDYEIVVFGVFNSQAQHAEPRNSSPLTGFVISPPQHGTGSIGSSVRNDAMELTPHGNRESRLRYNNSSPLELLDFENVTVDPRDGVDQLNVFGTPNSDAMTFDTATLALNGQTFGHANTEVFAAFGLSGDDSIGIGAGLSGAVTADGGDGRDLLSVVASGGGPMGLAMPGIIIDSRIINSVAVEAFALNAGSNDLVVAGAPDAVSGVSITPVSASRVQLDGGGRTYDLVTTGVLTVAGAPPQGGSQLPLRRVDIHATVFDDTITVSDTSVDVGGGLKPISLSAIASVRVFGEEGSDSFDVTPSSATSFFIDGGDPIGFGDSISVATPGATLFPGPQNDEGAFVVSGLKPVSFDHIESTPANALPTLSINDASVTEGDSGSVNLTLTVSLSVASSSTVMVSFATSNNTALAGIDYTSASGALVFAPGQTTKTLSIAVLGDIVDESDESFTVLLSNATDAVITDGQGVGMITDDDTPPSILFNNVSVTEGDSGTVNLTFTVFLSNPSDSTVTVDFATSDSTALMGLDYTSASGTLSFSPGVSSQMVNIAVLGDLIDEPSEDLTLVLSNAVNGSIGNGTGTGTILDNDLPPVISINDANVTEGDSGSTNAIFTVSLSAASASTITVAFATSDGTALAGTDYTLATGTVTFNSGETTKTLNVAVLGDGLDELDEGFTVQLANATNALLGDDTGVGTISDDDPASTLSLGDASVTEGDSGSVNLTFTVSLSSPSGQTVTADFTTSDGAALAGSDYVSHSGTLVFAPGQTSKTLNVAVLGDLVFETTTAETFNVTLSNASGLIIADGTGVGSITDNDSQTAAMNTILVILPDTANSVVVSRSGTNLLVRRGSVNLITPTPIADVDVLQIEGGLSSDRIRLDRSLKGFFAGTIAFFGGAGNDSLDARAMDAAVAIEFEGDDGNDTALGGPANDLLIGGDGNDSLVGNDGNDSLGGGEGTDRLTGGSGDDILCGDNGNDRLTGDAGADLLVGHEGNDSMLGGAGEDTLIGLEGNDTLRGDNDNDTLVGGENNDQLFGGTGNDLALGEEGNDTVNGDAGDDRIDGGDGTDSLLGGTGTGNDTIFGGAARDTIRGGAGNDSLAGGDDADSLFGDAGTDTVHRVTGIDTVSGAESQLDDNLDDIFTFDIGVLLDLCAF